MSSDKDNGGQAFPHPDYLAQGWEGMTLRDYYMVHAPREIPAWFHAAMPDERPRDAWTSEDGKRCYPNRYVAERNHGDLIVNQNAKAQEAWDIEQRKARQFQWPFAWADAMLKERAK